MVDMESIRAMTERIVQEFKPERIILFGSYAYGTPTSDSDVDLLVILPFQGQAPSKSLEILNKVNPKFAVDLLVRTPEQVQQRLAWNDFFCKRFLQKARSSMKPLTREWIDKAEGDFATARREYGCARRRIMMPFASMPSSALRSTSKRVCKRQSSLLAARTT